MQTLMKSLVKLCDHNIKKHESAKEKAKRKNEMIGIVYIKLTYPFPIIIAKVLSL